MINPRDVLTALYRTDLTAFIRRCFEVVSPTDTYLHNWHIEVIAEHLERCFHGDITRLIITMPPRSMKSICASIAFPAWVLGKDPGRRLICASYSADLAIKFARDCRTVMDSTWYQHAFPHTRLIRNATNDLETSQHGVRYATSTGGTLTGRGGNMIIIDDPMKPQDGTSAVQREAVKQWYDGTLYSRLDSKSDGVIILVMQRLHVDDLVAHLLEKEEWVHLNLPAIAEHEQHFQLPNGRRYVRSPGGILHPERESMDTLGKIQETIGSFNFSAQYQQQPIPQEGNLVKWSWFNNYDSAPPFEHGDMIVQSWDTASKDTELADYSVCTTWHVKGKEYYLLDVFRKKLNFPELTKAVIQQSKAYNASVILIEEAGSGIGLIQMLKQDRTAGVPYPTGIKPIGDKVTRLSNQSVKIEAGQVFLPNQAEWLETFQTELMAFPQGAHDDQVDSLSQFLNWIDIHKRKQVHVIKLQGL
ncbi:MAG: phage terminase large subunit [Sedimenticola sp.]